MRAEVNRAYPALRREWPGRVLRMHLPYMRGFPDFLLLHDGITLYAEVKWCPDRLRPKQALFLQELHEQGHRTAALGYDPDHGWVAWLRDYMDLRNEKLCWGGGHVQSPTIEGMINELLWTTR